MASANKRYVVQEGDCISSLAETWGLLPDTLWDANQDLKSLRKNPNVLFPGDELIVPEKSLKNCPAETDQHHRYVRKGVPTKFRLVLERFQQPLKNKQYLLSVDGKNYEGTTSATGLLEVSLPPNAREGVLRIPDEHIECELQFGFLDPLDELAGTQARLQNLGYYHGELDGEANDEFQGGLQAFQSDFGLPVTGELDDATKQKLFAEHDEEHDFPASSAAPPDQPASAQQDDDIVPDEDGVPTEEEDAAVFAELDRRGEG
ncbi:MAG TPA: peptidoglycan-binding protein [Candidatus Acidoferrales bacterium]|nr:peptidoglycan-binding protein [Candidatus Acidoferrales bacterium]